MREYKFRGYIETVGYMRNDIHKDECFYLNLQDKNVIIMQYTGIKDKNNKEIYEGDLVELVGYSHEGLYKVIWNNINSAYSIEDMIELTESFYDYEYIVRGNIYENAELMEE